MNIPPPRHAPLSRHPLEKTRETASKTAPLNTSTTSVAVTPEDTETWKEALTEDLAFYSDDVIPRSQPQPHAERQASLARLALASGTGEDVAAFDTPTKRPRIRLEGKPLHALAVLLAVLLAGVWIYLGVDGKKVRENSHETTSSTQTSAPQNTSTAEGKGASADIVVYISGAVTTPGVYTLPTGSRVNDCVEAAGGLTQDAQSAVVNLASALSDGEHIHIPAQGEDISILSSTNAGAPEAGSGKINLNTASASELEELPGIGPALSQTIITWREDNGRFTSPEDLLDVSGIGQAKYDKLKDLVTVG